MIHDEKLVSEAMAGHTPTPWKVGQHRIVGGMSDKDTFEITSEFVLGVCEVENYGMPGEANATFIVRAVNAHDELLEAVRNARAYLLEPRAFPSDHVRGMILSLGAAIAKAEGK